MLLREKVNLFLKIIGGSLFAALLLAVAAFVSINGPQIHSNMIRSHVGSATVMIMTDRGGGTGFHVEAPSGETYILTNRHICDGSSNGIVLVRSNNRREMPRRIIEVYLEHDLCLVEALPSVEGIKLASKEPVIGQIVGIVGHPRLNQLTLMRGEVVDNPVIDVVIAYNIEQDKCVGNLIDVSNDFRAIISGIKTVCVQQFTTYQTSYIVYPGNSGSPVVNFYGNVIGVHFAVGRDSVTHGFVVPLPEIKKFLKDY